tara:strand:- start:20 stop:259 length:240 start_codon:yes stop_codon:yes gene_type:complete
MRLLKIWLRLLNTSLTVAYYRARLLNQRILFQLDEWFSPPVSSKEISAFDEFEDEILDIEEEEEKKPYKPYDGPVSMTP